MQANIKKQNERQALRVFTICKNSINSIEKIESDLMMLQNIDPTVFQLIEGYKKEVDFLSKKFLSHIDECSNDAIQVDPIILDGLKTNCDSVVKQLEYIKNNYTNKESDHKVVLNFISPDYIF